MLESQLSFPVLAFYRSQHDNQSWLSCLTAILDTCAILLANFATSTGTRCKLHSRWPGMPQSTYRSSFKTPPRELPSDRLPDECYRCLMASLHESKLGVDTSEASAARLKELRAMYEPFIDALADYFKFDLPPIALSEVPIDNWQRSPWQERAPGIGSLPTVNPGDHFT